MSFTATIVIGAIIFFGVILIFVLLNDHFGWDLISDDNDDTTTSRSDSGSYTHKDLYGHISGFSNVSDNSSDHYSSNGYSASYRSGNDTYHYGTDGYHGRSHKSDSGEITHYGKDNMPRGYSRPNDRGGYDHFDKWGLPVGRSDKD